MMNVPVLGVVENMAWAVCPHCGEKLYVFGESHVEEVAAAHGLPVLARCPLNRSWPNRQIWVWLSRLRVKPLTKRRTPLKI